MDASIGKVCAEADAGRFQKMTKREIRRWLESQPVEHLAQLDHWLYGFMVRFSHPKPRTPEQATQFSRLVMMYRVASPKFEKVYRVSEVSSLKSFETKKEAA